MMRPTADSDGVTRVFSKELWGDPNIGPMLRQLGFAIRHHRHRRTGRGHHARAIRDGEDLIRKEIVDHIAWMKPRIVSELMRVQA